MNSDFRELLQAFNEDGTAVWYVSKEDLIEAKKAVARDQDLKDIDEIKRADK